MIRKDGLLVNTYLNSKNILASSEMDTVNERLFTQEYKHYKLLPTLNPDTIVEFILENDIYEADLNGKIYISGIFGKDIQTGQLIRGIVTETFYTLEGLTFKIYYTNTQKAQILLTECDHNVTLDILKEEYYNVGSAIKNTTLVVAQITPNTKVSIR